MNILIRLGVVLTGSAALTIGCARGTRPSALAPRFSAGVAHSQKEIPADPLSGADQPGALYRNPQPERTDLEPASGRPLSKTVQENVTAPGERGEEVMREQPASQATAAAAATRGATTRGATTVGTSSGQYLVIGGLIAEVN